MSETLINVQGVSKKFCRSLKTSLKYGIQDLSRELLNHHRIQNSSLRPSEFWALSDINFQLNRGECLGLIGQNGAGKTTLLRILTGLIKPTSGHIEIRGRVGALIALGAGFSPTLSGRENIYVNGSILGIPKNEISRKLNDIVDFAEIGESIDAPVQTYSSGMCVRLGFSIAAILIKPDILFLDEVLAVGDNAFKMKCYHQIDNLVNNSAVIFVSHDIPQLARVCTHSIILESGQIIFNGSIQSGLDMYESVTVKNGGELTPTSSTQPPISAIRIIEIPNTIEQNNEFKFKLQIISSERIHSTSLRLDIKNRSGAYCASCLTEANNYHIDIENGNNTWEISLSRLPLKPGAYTMSILITTLSGTIIASSSNHKTYITGKTIGIPSDCQLAVQQWVAC